MVISYVKLQVIRRSSVTTITHGVQRKGYLSCWKPREDVRFIYICDEKPVKVEAIDTFRLLLITDYYFDLKETYVVPLFRQNLIFISILDQFSNSCSLEIEYLIFLIISI